MNKLYSTVEDDRGVRYVRGTADPIGSSGPVLADVTQAPSPLDLLGSPDPFPLEWLERPPSWLEQGEGVRVVTDGPERGRAAGYIRLHNTCYQDGTGSCRTPPPVPYEAFHRGHAAVVNDEGHVKEVAVGAIAIVGGHSDRRGDATAAIAHIDQPGKAKLRGVLVEDEVGLLFLGAARSDMTRVEASMVNQSDTSGEWWPLFERGEDGKVSLVGNDLIGIALVTGGAFRKSIPNRFRVLAAALGRDLDDEELALMVHADSHVANDSPQDCGCDVEAESVLILPSRYDLPVEDDTQPDVVQAATAEDLGLALLAAPSDEIAELRGAVDTLTGKVEDLSQLVATLQREFMQYVALNLAEEEISLPEQVAGLEEEQRAIERRLVEMEQRQGMLQNNVAPTEEPTSPEGPAGPGNAMDRSTQRVAV